MATLPAGGETGPVPGYRLVAATFTTCTVKSSARSWFVRVKTMMALPATAVQAGVAASAPPAIQAVTPRTARAIASAAASAMMRLCMWSRLPVRLGVVNLQDAPGGRAGYRAAPGDR